jgi:hypothetical protein
MFAAGLAWFPAKPRNRKEHTMITQTADPAREQQVRRLATRHGYQLTKLRGDYGVTQINSAASLTPGARTGQQRGMASARL